MNGVLVVRNPVAGRGRAQGEWNDVRRRLTAAGVAFDERRELMLVDTFGTADEDRFWDLAAYEKGQQVELSKELVRQYYRKIGYHERLMAARKAGRPEPGIPPLPDNVLKEVSDLYISLFERLTGDRFR